MKGGITELEYYTTPPKMPVDFEVNDLSYRGAYMWKNGKNLFQVVILISEAKSDIDDTLLQFLVYCLGIRKFSEHYQTNMFS